MNNSEPTAQQGEQMQTLDIELLREFELIGADSKNDDVQGRRRRLLPPGGLGQLATRPPNKSPLNSDQWTTFAFSNIVTSGATS